MHIGPELIKVKNLCFQISVILNGSIDFKPLHNQFGLQIPNLRFLVPKYTKFGALTFLLKLERIVDIFDLIQTVIYL